jgi:hypothetical protein
MKNRTLSKKKKMTVCKLKKYYNRQFKVTSAKLVLENNMPALKSQRNYRFVTIDYIVGYVNIRIMEQLRFHV